MFSTCFYTSFLLRDFLSFYTDSLYTCSYSHLLLHTRHLFAEIAYQITQVSRVFDTRFLPFYTTCAIRCTCRKPNSHHHHHSISSIIVVVTTTIIPPHHHCCHLPHYPTSITAITTTILLPPLSLSPPLPLIHPPSPIIFKIEPVIDPIKALGHWIND